MLQSWLDDFKQWAASPFAADMSAMHWALFIGLMLVILTLWARVFAHIKGAAA